ncbi:sorting nexin-25-like isoform X2 [Clavelina lepadiformis]|uniref:sorting nexin-25-like isoform X2 n=1 Tax=Clavelina lepadiformis TaxID=159417 RepID=UPI004040ED79
MTIGQTLILGFVLCLVLALCIANPWVVSILINLITSLVAIVLGSLIGVFLIYLLLNYIEKHKLYLEQESDQCVQRTQGVALEQRANLPSRFSAKFYLRALSFWFYTRSKLFLANVAIRLARSPLIQAQTGNIDTGNNRPAQARGVFEIIHPYGKTPEEMLCSPYGPSSYQSGTKTCVSPNIDEIMHNVFEYTYRDYVETWYSKVSSDRGNFHKMIRADYWVVVKAFSERLAKVDTVNLIMNRFVKCVHEHMDELKRTAKMHPSEQKPMFTLHPCLRDRNTELGYLRQICDYILILTLPPESARITSLRYILREVLAGLAFLPMVETLCDPDYINRTILSYLQWKDNAQEEQSRAYAYAATYEDFIKIINDCKSVQALSQIRYRIMTEIIHATTISSLKKDQSKAGKARSLDKGELLINRDLKRYINQCQVAKQQCEKKIRALGGEDYGGKYAQSEGGLMESQLLSFEEIMNSPIARSFFLKYLKKIGKASLLSFWNQIEIVKTTNPSGKELAKILSHVFQTHIINNPLEQVSIEKSSIRGMQDCVIGNKPPDDFFQVQKQVYDIMQKDHYPSFVVSDVYSYQLMPEILDQSFEKSLTASEQDLSKAAFGGGHSSDASLERLRRIEEKLEYKAQALESLMSATKVDSKVKDQLNRDIQKLQHAKCMQQLHIERTSAWWDHMGMWNASIEKVHASQTDGLATPVYTIIVQCSGVPFYETTDDVSGWIVARSLNEFHDLHQRLKECSPWLKKHSLPKVPMFRLRGLTDKFLNNSKESLDAYLNDILKDEILRCSQTVYGFLSPGPDGTNLSKSSEEEAADNKIFTGVGGFFKRVPKDLLDRVVNQLAEEDDTDDLLDEDRQVREVSEWLVSEPMLGFYLQAFLDSMWPNGKLAEQVPSRTDDEKTQTKLELQVEILRNIPEALNGLVGQENGKRGVLKIFHALQDKRLNKHLFYNLLAEIMEEVFPEILEQGNVPGN